MDRSGGSWSGGREHVRWLMVWGQRAGKMAHGLGARDRLCGSWYGGREQIKWLMVWGQGASQVAHGLGFGSGGSWSGGRGQVRWLMGQGQYFVSSFNVSKFARKASNFPQNSPDRIKLVAWWCQ